MTSLTVVRGTMVAATAAWAVGEVLMRRSRRLDRWGRHAWTAGIGLSAVHVALAFHYVYGWNQDTAVTRTAQQAADRFGLGWRGSLYVNYGFLTLWLADVVGWWIAPATRARRAPAIESARRGVFLFMFANGAIVFASGIGRLVGVASVAAVLVAALRRPPHSA